MFKMKRMYVVLLTLSIFALFASCKSEDKSLSRVLNEGVYKVGFFDNCEPFSVFLEGGEVSGFDADVHREIARRLGAELRAVRADTDTIVAMLATNKVDCSANNIMLSRKSKDLKPTKTMFDYKTVLGIREESDFSKLSDFEKRNVAFVADGAAENEFDANSALDTTAVPAAYLTESDAVMALMEGEVDAVITSDIYLEHCKNVGVSIKKLSKPLKKEAYTAIFSRDDSSLIKRVGEIIAEMKKDGTMTKIAEKWFDEDVLK